MFGVEGSRFCGFSFLCVCVRVWGLGCLGFRV